MGLLDTVLGTESQAQLTLSPAEAFAAIALAATAIDGYLSDDEVCSITSVLSRSKLFRNYTNEMMNKLVDKILSILKRRDGINVLFISAKQSLTQELREAAFAVATDLVLNDGILTEEETYFLNDLYQSLGISSDLALQIVQVVLIKNRG
ncbi:tellurite resistance TerB family protein [Calothrix membranacea FACHB-236]|uniref:tellurite resistance TerB family protein n=1 Tax=Tolypothrix sp. PCC 7910 TaxID=2099387 RepID=UPI0014278B99|nr:tellurite resistance TerB family protein [Tolypothrix sp. PCC 7910]MBD2169060.1 tellurite resistance TerB family protein [Calothrix membranacea FACHB-236]QIR35638.1 tellurite resistance TerB family protein [Tolypothrix sp. PCC 7910]